MCMCVCVYVCAFLCKNRSIDEAVTHMLILSGVIGVCVHFWAANAACVQATVLDLTYLRFYTIPEAVQLARAASQAVTRFCPSRHC